MEIFKNRDVIVFSPHPDDETLGCGGFLMKLKKEKNNLHWIIFTAIKEEEGWDRNHVSNKKKQIQKVSKKYGFKTVNEMGYNPGSLDTVPITELILKIKRILNDIKPSLILIPHHADIHTDHKICNQAIQSASKNFRSKFIKTILAYETLSETEFATPDYENTFLPNYYVDISKYIEKKINIMKIFKEEIMKEPYPRSVSSIKALARFRGSRIGVKYAEAFMLIMAIN